MYTYTYLYKHTYMDTNTILITWLFNKITYFDLEEMNLVVSAWTDPPNPSVKNINITHFVFTFKSLAFSSFS